MNVPDDWNSYYQRCSLCRTRYHASEGGCMCTEDLTKCAGNCARGLEGYYPDDQIVTVDGLEYCKACAEEYAEEVD